MSQQPGEYEILFHWNHLDWVFTDESQKSEFYRNKYWKGAMPAGFKMDIDGNYYLSVPRWAHGIPATVNKIIVIDGKAMLTPYPNLAMNEIGNPMAFQSVLGWEIDELGRAWFLDQGHVEDNPCTEGMQKIVCWDIHKNELVDIINIPHEIASFNASFLNDLVVDNKNGFVYIADSGIYTDPLEGGLIIYNMRTRQLRRVFHQHISTQDMPGYWFKIAGKSIWADKPMRTGADGIALSADRSTLYWCPLTSRHLYCVDTTVLQDFSTPNIVLEEAVVDLGDKGTNTDGMGADNNGLIYYTMLEGQGIGIFNPKKKTFESFISDERMVWVDGMTFDNNGYLIFNNNRLHELFRDQLDWENPYNLIVWKAFLGSEIKSYLYAK